MRRFSVLIHSQAGTLRLPLTETTLCHAFPFPRKNLPIQFQPDCRRLHSNLYTSIQEEELTVWSLKGKMSVCGVLFLIPTLSFFSSPLLGYR